MSTLNAFSRCASANISYQPASTIRHSATNSASPATPRRTRNGAVGRLIANKASRTVSADCGVHCDAGACPNKKLKIDMRPGSDAGINRLGALRSNERGAGPTSIRGHLVVVNANVADLAPVDLVLFGLDILVDDAERNDAIAGVRVPVHRLALAGGDADAGPFAPRAALEGLEAADGVLGFVVHRELVSFGRRRRRHQSAEQCQGN